MHDYIGRSQALIQWEGRKFWIVWLTNQFAACNLWKEDGNDSYAYKTGNVACVLSSFASLSLKGKYNFNNIRKITLNAYICLVCECRDTIFSSADALLMDKPCHWHWYTCMPKVSHWMAIVLLWFFCGRSVKSPFWWKQWTFVYWFVADQRQIRPPIHNRGEIDWRIGRKPKQTLFHVSSKKARRKRGKGSGSESDKRTRKRASKHSCGWAVSHVVC